VKQPGLERFRVRPKTYYTKYAEPVISNVVSPSTGSGTGLPGQWACRTAPLYGRRNDRDNYDNDKDK